MTSAEKGIGSPQPSLSSMISPVAQAIWKNGDDYKRVAVESEIICLVASRINRGFFFGQTKKCVIGGLLYIVGQNCRSAQTQRVIADALSTTDVSIRVQQRRWLNEFPILFAYVNKLVSENLVQSAGTYDFARLPMV